MKDDMYDLNRYDDIINLPHHVSNAHPRMALPDRAAQFSPFAALTGYDRAIKETERLTDERIELGESQKVVLDEKLRIIQEQLSREPEVTITYFQPDDKKAGGAYITTNGIVRKLDDYERTVVMKDGRRIEISEIMDIDGEIVRTMDNF
jgi:hypothetical protein